MLLQGELEDGTPVVFRPISPADKALLAEGFNRLSERSRYRRFFRHIDHLSEQQLRYLTEVDGKDHVAFVCLTREGDPVGVGRWVRLAGEPTVAEGAITVVDRYHGKGVGKTLLYLLAKEAIAQGVTAFRAWVVGDNDPILHALAELGVEMGRWEMGTMEVTIPLPSAVEQLERTAAPRILRAVASGALAGTAPTGKPQATRLEPPSADEAVVEEQSGSGNDRSQLGAEDQRP